jgi:hypothetical protein
VYQSRRSTSPSDAVVCRDAPVMSSSCTYDLPPSYVAYGST